MTQDEIVAKLLNPLLTEHDGQRLILDPEDNRNVMQAAVTEIKRLQDEVDLLRANLGEMDRQARD